MTLATALLSVLALQEPKVNPRYEFWSECKVGSWVKQRMVLKAGEMDITTVIVSTLLEVTPEKAVVETATTSKFGDREMKLPPKKEEISQKPDPAQPMKPVGESEEEITVADKKLKCKVYEFEMEQNGQKAKGKSWTSKTIPGGVARSEFTSEKMPAPMKLEAVEWEKK
jgi:hypothetical protein